MVRNQDQRRVGKIPALDISHGGRRSFTIYRHGCWLSRDRYRRIDSLGIRLSGAHIYMLRCSRTTPSMGMNKPKVLLLDSG